MLSVGLKTSSVFSKILSFQKQFQIYNCVYIGLDLCLLCSNCFTFQFISTGMFIQIHHLHIPSYTFLMRPKHTPSWPSPTCSKAASFQGRSAKPRSAGKLPDAVHGGVDGVGPTGGKHLAPYRIWKITKYPLGFESAFLKLCHVRACQNKGTFHHPNGSKSIFVHSWTFILLISCGYLQFCNKTTHLLLVNLTKINKKTKKGIARRCCFVVFQKATCSSYLFLISWLQLGPTWVTTWVTTVTGKKNTGWQPLWISTNQPWDLSFIMVTGADWPKIVGWKPSYWCQPKNRGILPPRWMVKIMENPIKWMIWGYTYFWKTSYLSWSIPLQYLLRMLDEWRKHLFV